VTGPGARVYAIKDADQHEVHLFGLGTYVGDEPRPGWDPDAVVDGRSLREIVCGVVARHMVDNPFDNGGSQADRIEATLHAMSLNPRIDLDAGGTVWGFQCWWAPGDEADLLIRAAGRRIVTVPLPAAAEALATSDGAG
jgi:hypothetical protein